MKNRKMWALLLAMVMLAGVLTACGASSEAMDMENGVVEAPREEAAEEGIYGSSTSDSTTGSAAAENQKLIRRVYIDAETEDLEALMEELSAQISKLGGYIESQEVYNGSSYYAYRSRGASLTVRIPAENLDGFVGQVKGISNVVNYSESTEDVTLTYVATESRIAALETEQERLLELLSKAENMTDLLTIEERLTEVRYELENVTSQLRVLSNKVSYATVSLNIDQVEVYTEVEEPTFWQRITGGFTGNLKNIGEDLVDFCVWAITYSPQLVFWALVITVGVIVGKRTARKQKAARAAKMPPFRAPEQKDEDKQ